jgi:predicted nucleic acid-binding protein
MMMTANPSDRALLDSNILIYTTQEEAPQYPAAKHLRDQAIQGTVSACISPQILLEFYAVVTNPRRASAPLTPEEAIQEMRRYTESRELLMIFPGNRIVERILTLLAAHPVTSQDIHDLHLAATMIENGVTKVYTFSREDFAPFSAIQVLTPAATPAG